MVGPAVPVHIGTPAPATAQFEKVRRLELDAPLTCLLYEVVRRQEGVLGERQRKIQELRGSTECSSGCPHGMGQPIRHVHCGVLAGCCLVPILNASCRASGSDPADEPRTKDQEGL